MCGRVVQASDPLRYVFVDGLSLPDSRTRPPSYNVAPGQKQPYGVAMKDRTPFAIAGLRDNWVAHFGLP